jgi:hypothetical protein
MPRINSIIITIIMSLKTKETPSKNRSRRYITPHAINRCKHD